MGSPLYLEIFKDLKEQILRGDLKVGDMLQSENELVKLYNSSRNTVRQSLLMLENDGFINSYPGKGYFVIEPDHSKYTLFFNELKSGNKSNNTSKVISVNSIKPDDEVRQKLQIPSDKKVVNVIRILYSSEGPVAYDVKYLPYEKGKPIVEKAIEYATFPDMVAKKGSTFAIKKELCIYVELPRQEVNRSLNLKDHEPLLVIEQSLYDHENKPIGWGKTYYGSEYRKINAYSDIGEYS